MKFKHKFFYSDVVFQSKALSFKACETKLQKKKKVYSGPYCGLRCQR